MIEDTTTLSNTTWEIVIMLLIAFILGWLLHHFMHCRKTKENLPPVPPPKATKPAASKEDTVITPLVSTPDLSQIDDLKVVEGIGPKIESLLHAADITSMRGLAVAETDVIKKILDEAGPRFRMHNPKTWSIQATLIADEKWDELKAYQNSLVGGREP